MKRIAILTGASSGMGRELALQLAQWETFDELWVIARRADRLEALKEQVPFPVRPISLDLTDPQALELYRDLLENANANTRAILDKLTSQEMAAKDAQIQAQSQQIFGLQLAASQQAQNNYLVNTLRPCPTPAYLTCNPWASQAAYGSCGSYGNCGCGC